MDLESGENSIRRLAPSKGPYPWYDSDWLNTYILVKKFLAQHYPKKLPEFEAALAPFRTAPHFKTLKVDDFIDKTEIQKMRELIRELKVSDFEYHELASCGRLVIHNHPYFTELQRKIADKFGELVKEPVEPSYNFLGLNDNTGYLPIHLDAPNAKWTLDLCIDQSHIWPIKVSEVLPWPEDMVCNKGWEAKLKASQRFETYELRPGESLIFSGTSQWHYRDPIEPAGGKGYCHLVFFHFIPKGTYIVSRKKNWPDYFGIKELEPIVQNNEL